VTVYPPSFTDVPASHIFYPYVEKVKAKGGDSRLWQWQLLRRFSGHPRADGGVPRKGHARGQMAVFLSKTFGF